MKDIALDRYGNPIFNGHDYVWLYDADVVTQKIYITLQTQLREFEPDQELGLNHDNLFGKNVVIDFLEKDIIDAIKGQVPEVDAVNSIAIKSEENRTITVNISCSTSDFGNINNEYSLDKEVI